LLQRFRNPGTESGGRKRWGIPSLFVGGVRISFWSLTFWSVIVSVMIHTRASWTIIS